MANLCGINSAESNRVVLRYLAEDPACWSLTPSTGKPREIRFTSSSLAASKQTKVSAEVRADRMVPSIVEVGAESGGDISVEFSAGALDDFLQSFVLGAWTRPMTFDKFSGAAVSITSTSAVSIAGGDYRAYFTVGRVIKLEGFLTPSNNNYFTIASLAFTSGSTVIGVVGTPLTAETGNAYSKVADANDVIVLKSTAIRFGTGGANEIDSNGGNAFSAAVAAGQLIPGQRIYIEGIGYEKGEIEITTLPADGDTVTVNDGVSAIIFEFDSNGAFVGGHLPVVIGVDVATTAAALANAINEALNQRKVLVGATVATDTVTVKNFRDTVGSLTKVGAGTTLTAFAGSDPTLHGFANILSVTNDVITIDREITTDANAGAAAITIKGSHLRNPGTISQITKQSYSIETGFTDVGQYFLQNGLRVGSFELKVKAGDLLTGKIAFQGKATTPAQTSILGSSPYTPLAAVPNDVLNATVNVGALRKNGVALSTAIEAIELKGDASLRSLKGVGSKFPVGIAYGRMSVTGQVSAYFATLDLYNNFINHDTVSLAFDLADNDFNAYTFTLPAIKILSDPIAPGGIDQDIIETLNFTSQRDPGLNTQLMVDRFSSTLPPIV